MDVDRRRMSLIDYIKNVYYKVRYTFYRKFVSSKLKNYSSKEKSNKLLTFDDDFNEVSWNKFGDGAKWKNGTRFHPDRLNVYYGPPEIVGSSKGKFTVKYKPKSFQHKGETIIIPFEVSLLSSEHSFNQQYGRFECRCTLPPDKGVWPAFWLWGSTWPPEIDVLECYGRKDGKKAGVQEINLHYGHDEEGNRSRTRTWKIKIEDQKNLATHFHEYAVEWFSDKIECFTDGVKIYQYTRKDILERWFNVDIAKMRIVINHSIREQDVGKDESDYYSEFLVDYIRAYKNI